MLNTKITDKDGKLYFEVDGEFLSPYAYMTYCPNERYIDEFKKAGYRLFSFPVYMCDWGINTETGLKQFCEHVIRKDGTYNFDVVDSYLQMFAPNGNGGYIFPRVYLQTPSYWDFENPDEISRDFSGEPIRCDLSSKKVREFLWDAFKALIDHIEASKWKNCVIGYQIAGGGTEEWAHQLKYDAQFAGYSTNEAHGFINWLKEKYTDVKLLNQNWNREYVSFEEITLPTPGELSYASEGMVRNSKKEMHVIDFYNYRNDLVADTIMYFAQKVKAYTEGKAVTGAFYGYIWMFHKAYKGHNALHKLLCSKDIDFIASTNGWSEPGLSWPFGSAAQSALLHGKLFMCEGDIRTHLTDSLDKTMPHAVPDGNDYYTSDVWRAVKDEFHASSVVKKAIARILTTNVGMWWFDMFSGWFSSGHLMELIKLMLTLNKESAFSGLGTDVALVLDETSPYYTALEYGAKGYFGDRTPVYNRCVCDEFKTELGRMGAPYDVFEAKDLTDPSFDPNRYKLYIFPDMVKPSPEVREAVEKRIKGGERTLFWCYFADWENNSTVTEFNTTYNKFEMPRRGKYKDMGFPKISVSCPSFTSETIEQSVVVASFDESCQPCVLYREHKNYRCFYSLLPSVPAELLREIALMAGVHLYSMENDVIYAGGNIVALHSDKGGTKHLFFPKSIAELTDVETGEKMKFYDSHLFFTMEKDDTRIFKVKFM